MQMVQVRKNMGCQAEEVCPTGSGEGFELFDQGKGITKVVFRRINLGMDQRVT